MVRLIPVEVDGKIVYREDAPEVCPSGHEGLLPTWSPCSQCRFACRHWRCETCGAMVRDDDHVCRT